MWRSTYIHGMAWNEMHIKCTSCPTWNAHMNMHLHEVHFVCEHVVMHYTHAMHSHVVHFMHVIMYFVRLNFIFFMVEMGLFFSHMHSWRWMPRYTYMCGNPSCPPPIHNIPFLKENQGKTTTIFRIPTPDMKDSHMCMYYPKCSAHTFHAMPKPNFVYGLWDSLTTCACACTKYLTCTSCNALRVMYCV